MEVRFPSLPPKNLFRLSSSLNSSNVRVRCVSKIWNALTDRESYWINLLERNCAPLRNRLHKHQLFNKSALWLYRSKMVYTNYTFIVYLFSIYYFPPIEKALCTRPHNRRMDRMVLEQDNPLTLGGRMEGWQDSRIRIPIHPRQQRILRRPMEG